MTRAAQVRLALASVSNPARALHSASFFKTGPGQYGEGDLFLGATVPAQRKVAREAKPLPLDEVSALLESEIHEHRLTALFILVAQFNTADPPLRKQIFSFYLANLRHINNWDLVDSSAPQIVGAHLLNSPRKLLYKLAKSKDLWERRVAIVATQALIRAGKTDDTYAIAALLLADQHHLIHKATGWMLREAGRHSRATLLDFLKQHYSALPRTALRYAIEHLPPQQRKQILSGHFSPH